MNYRTIQQATRNSMCWVILAIASLGGCSSGVQTANAVDTKLASETLVEVLTIWKSGATLGALEQKVPKIVVQDFDWQQGIKLLSFEVQENPTAVDANLLIEVDLVFAGKDNRTFEKTVTYIVGTDPVLTVFRKIF